MTSILDIARVVRSKNAGPFELTLDIIFDDAETYERVKASGQVDAAAVARLYAIDASEIRRVIYFDPALAIKVVLPRRVASGLPGDTDVYGAQQHAPLLELEISL